MILLSRSPLLLGLCLLAPVAVGQNTTQEIVVTANRLQQANDTVMAATTIIDKESIRKSSAQSLAELLSGVAGMQFAPAGGQGAQTSLFLRGTESDHTLIMIDGVQMTTSTGAAARLENIPLDQIDHIEIVRGPRSSVYGSEAIGGVLNIITRPQVDEGFSGTINLMAGTQDSSNGNISLQGTTGNTVLSLNASHRETEGINFKAAGDPDDDGYENDSLSLSLSHHFTNRVSFFSSYSSFDTNSEYDDGEVEADSQQLAAKVTATLTENWDSSLIAEQFEEDNKDMSAFGTTTSQSENRKLSWQNIYSFNNGDVISFGLDHQEQELRYATFGAIQSSTSRDSDGVYGVFIHDGEPLDLTLSLRNDDNEGFGNYSTGSLALGHHFSDNLRTWVSFGTAFKAPNLIDLYVDFPSFFFFSNPNLEPETSQSLELGLQGLTWGTQWQLNVFRNDIDDLIATDATFTSLANIQRARISGVEATLATAFAGWQMDAALTLLDHENRSTGEELLRRPNQTLSLNLARQFGPVDMTINLLAQNDHRDIDPISFGSSQVGGYGIVNLIAGYQFSDVVDLRLRVGNVFDQDYQIVDGFNTFGRTAQLTLRYQF